MDPFTGQIPLDGMLCNSGFTHEKPQAKTLSSEYVTGLSGTSVLGLAGLVSYRTSGFNHAYVLPLLRFALYFFSDKTKGEHCLNGASLQQSTCAEITRLSIGT